MGVGGDLGKGVDVLYIHIYSAYITLALYIGLT